MGEGWAPSSLNLSAAYGVAVSSLLLSHASTARSEPDYRRTASGPSDAAYALSLYGECAPAAQLNLLTALALLARTRPVFPIVAMLGERCWKSAELREELQARGATPVRQPEVRGVRCVGRRYGPDSRPLAWNATGSYFDATYTILAAWNLTKFRAVLVLDSDLAVRRSLDHVLMAMLARPEIAEARTPEGCLDAVSSSPYRGNYFNTGVWGVRPDARVYTALSRWLTSGTSEHQCGIGIQTAAKGFFHKIRIDPHRFYAPADCCVDMLPETENVAMAPPRRPLLRPWEVLQLHAGYNLKANQGVSRCLQKQRQPANASYVVHWSGSRKPYIMRAHQTLDGLEWEAYADYMRAHCQLWRTAFAPRDLVPERREVCSQQRADGEFGPERAPRRGFRGHS